jgi:hypothetical protein
MALVKIIDYGISLTAAKLPQVVVQFETGKGEKYTWYGSFKENSKEWTIKKLLTMGFSSDTLEPLANGMAGGALNHLQEYDITIEEKADQNGQVRKQVAWINLPGQSAIRGKLEASDALNALKGLNLKGDILAAKKSLPMMPQQKTGTDEIPF